MQRVSALGLCAVTTLVAASASSSASLIQLGRWSSVFTDDLWVGGRALGAQTLMPRLPKHVWPCEPRVRALLCKRVIFRDERLSSTAADITPNRYFDLTGHAMSVSGMIIAERVEVDDFAMRFADAVQWSVAGEKVFDEVGTHSWSLLPPDTAPYQRYLPIQAYRFVGEGPGADWVRVSETTVPEPPTWALVTIGLAGFGVASYCAVFAARAGAGRR